MAAAAATGRPVIPLYVFDEPRPLGGASRWWLERSLVALSASLEALSSRLVVRSGDAAEIVKALARETGAEVYWNRLYEPAAMARDTALKAALGARSFNASLLSEPWTVKPYRVFTPYWRAVRPSGVSIEPAPKALRPPATWPASEMLKPASPPWASGFDIWTPGEAGAQARLDAFDPDGYGLRDHPGVEATSRLSPHLHFGEIGPRQVVSAIEMAGGSEKFLSELGWREFNHHLLFHNPELPSKPLKDLDIPWRRDPKAFEAWTRGMTGYPLVDAGMRELWATGFMHNRVRMVAASFLVKHLLIDWREGEAWFWDTLVDADLANNVGNWQWVAGCGPTPRRGSASSTRRPSRKSSTRRALTSAAGPPRSARPPTPPPSSTTLSHAPGPLIRVRRERCYDERPGRSRS